MHTANRAAFGNPVDNIGILRSGFHPCAFAISTLRMQPSSPCSAVQRGWRGRRRIARSLRRLSPDPNQQQQQWRAYGDW